MSALSSIWLTSQTDPELELFGEGLSWDQLQQDELRGYAFIRLRIGKDRWLRIDSEPRSSIAAPNPFPVESLLRIDAKKLQPVPGQPAGRRLASNAEAVFAFRWSNPLTPCSLGLWMYLDVRPLEHDSALGILRYNALENPASGLYYAQKLDPKKPEWSNRKLLDVPGNDTRVTFAAFAAATMAVAKDHNISQDDLGTLFRDLGTNSEWLADVAAADADGAFTVGPVPASGGDVSLSSSLFVDNARTIAINGKALGIEHKDAMSRPFSALTMSLRAARRCDGSQGNSLPRWFLDWQSVPGQHSPATRPHECCLEGLWSTLARHYPLGLAAARARNCLTFAPTRLFCTTPVTLRFDVAADRAGVVNSTLLQQISVGSQQTKITLEFGGAIDPQRQPFALRDVIATDDFRPDPSFAPVDEAVNRPPGEELLALHLAGGMGNGDWLIGAVRVKAKSGIAESRLGITPQRDGALYGQTPFGMDLQLVFADSSARAASQDPEPGFETLSAWLDRERPLSYDTGAVLENLKLTIIESADAEQSRLLRLKLEAQMQIKQTTDVVVLDPSPLTIARVISDIEAAPGTLVAEYTDDNDLPAEWVFASKQGKMQLVLPPQAIGEEMIKGRLYRRTTSPPTEVPTVPFDFRLSPSATLDLDRTDIDTARALAPWTLRRLLGQRLGVVGVSLSRAQFELLYGLTTTLTAPGLRIAELDALVGRIPFADELLDLLRAARLEGRKPSTTPPPVDTRLRRRQAERVARWIRDLLYRPSWWPVFRDFTDRRRLVLDRDVEFKLRTGRETAHPFDIDYFAIQSPYGTPDETAAFSRLPEKSAKRPPLRGGVDWPFQSREVYRELKNAPVSVGGSIEGLAFGPLGGDGEQTAVFSNGKTLIISSTTQGRLNSLTLIRVGRIAQLWNHARHVIVYERTSRRAPRYKFGDPPEYADTWDHQTSAFEGFMALRKMREYIEITQPRRTYPDSRADASAAGPFIQSTFETVIIPVKASWGEDVKDGWIMRLRGPLDRDEEQYFPFPRIFLDFARAPGKGTGRIAQPVLRPERLKFFTSTRPDDGGDTDVWPEWPAIDYPVVRAPKPAPLPFKPSFKANSRQPSAAQADFGQQDFTVELGPAEEAVNLMHGRSGTGIEAKIFTVSLARGGPRAAVPPDSLHERVGQVFGSRSAVIVDGVAELTETLRRKAENAREARLSDDPQLAEDAKALLDRLSTEVSSISKTINDNQTQLEHAGVPSWTDTQKRLGAAFEENAKRLKADLSTQLNFKIDGLKEDELERFKRQAQSTIESVCEQACRRIDEIAFVPEQALRVAQQACDDLSARLTRLTNELGVTLSTELAEVRKRVEENPAALDDLEARWRNAMSDGAARFRGIAVDVERWLGETVAPFFSQFAMTDAQHPDTKTHFFAKIQKALRNNVIPVSESLQLALDEVPPFELGIDWDALQGLIAELQPLDGWADELTGKLEELWDSPILKAGAGNWREPLREAKETVQKQCNAARDAIEAIPDLGHLGTVLKEQAEKFKQVISDQFDAIPAAIQGVFDDLKQKEPWSLIDGQFDQAKAFAQQVAQKIDAARALFADPTKEITEIARELGDVGNDVLAHVAATARHLEHAILEDKAVAGIYDLARQSGDAVLALTRALAEGPVADALACTRDAVGYYYEQAKDILDVTRSSAVFNDLGKAALNALSTYLPFDRVRDRLMPQLAQLRIGDLLPDFGGLKLEYLFPELRLPDDPLGEYDWIKLKHGFDKDRLTAWADVTIDRKFEETPDLFVLPPIAVKLDAPVFSARSHLEIDARGNKSQTSRASLSGDWIVTLSGKPIVTIREGVLLYDSNGGFDFQFDSENVILAEELQFITEALAALMPQEEGLIITPLLPAGISAELSLPLPDIGTGAFTLTGITLYTHFDLLIQGGFEIRTGVWLCRPDRPFGLAVLFLGGGGWFGVDVSYRPPKQFITHVSIGIAAGAFVAINFSVARASAGLMFTAGVDFYRDWSKRNGTTAVSLGLLIWGEFSLMGIASAALRLTLRIVYEGESGSMTGYGRITVKIKICWCFTLRVDKAVQKPFKGGKKESRAKALSASTPVSLHAFTVTSTGANALPGPALTTAALPFSKPTTYADLPDPDIDTAVDLHFESLDIEEVA